MSLANDLDAFIRSTGEDVFIEAEARPSRLESFFDEYNSRYSPNVDENSDGIICLEEDANKWGLELRLYLHQNPPRMHATYNTAYRSDYSYRINDKDVIMELFDLGYRIGQN